MLRSIARHFNETVFRGPDTEGGGGDVELNEGTGGLDGGGGDPADGGDDGGEGGGSKEPLTVREQIKKSIAETSEPASKDAKAPRDKKTGRFGDRQRGEGGEAPKPGDPPQQAAPPAEPIPAPDSLSKEAKAEWDKAPPAIQQAFIKREQDMAQGVQALQQRYQLIDQALAPHTDALRQMNATPADAVNRMFLWFKALAGSPAEAFPQLAKNMGIDWARLSAATNGGQQQQQQPAAGQQVDPAVQGNGNQGAPEIPEPVRQYVGQLETKIEQLTRFAQQLGGQIGPIQQNIQSQNQLRTEENLSLWSKDKPYFEKVRQDMAKLIESGIVPLKAGQVDLDTAYERAIYFNPEVRAEVLAAQQQANQQVQQQSQAAATTAQQTNVNRARKAAVSLAPSSPGNGNGPVAAKKKPGEKLSVRDSLKAAVAELRDQ